MVRSGDGACVAIIQPWHRSRVLKMAHQTQLLPSFHQTARNSLETNGSLFKCANLNGKKQRGERYQALGCRANFPQSSMAPLFTSWHKRRHSLGNESVWSRVTEEGVVLPWSGDSHYVPSTMLRAQSPSEWAQFSGACNPEGRR